MSHSMRVCGAVAFALLITGLQGQTKSTEQSPADLLRTFKSMFVNAHTVYIKKGVVDGEILKQLQKRKLDLDIAIKTDSSAEVVLNIERQAVWPAWDYSYRMEHQSSGTVLAAGKVKAIDGGSAAKQIAQQIVQRIAQARNPETKQQSSVLTKEETIKVRCNHCS
jgi:hypothetical protein